MTEKSKKPGTDNRTWHTMRWDIVLRTGTDPEETEKDQLARMAMLENNVEAWFAYYFPKFAFAAPASFHINATKRIIEHQEWYEVRLWSRELAKSTRTMLEVFYLTLVGHPAIDNLPRLKKKYVVLVSNSLENAVRLLMPYRANLEHNKRIKQDYGEQENSGKWQATEFTTLQGIAFRAVGIGQSPRGARNEEARPDVLIFDDIDTDADCLNPQIITKNWKWIEEAAIGTRSVSGKTTILFCGNRIAQDCCIVRAEKYADIADQVNIRDEHGMSVWPAKNSEHAIDRVLSQKSYAASQKEYFNNPLTEGAVFGRLAFKPARPLSEYEILVCYTDPSYKTTNDYKATVLVGLWKGEYHVIKCFLAQATTLDMVSWLLEMVNYVKNAACYFYMETVFMQDVILREVYETGKKMGYTIPLRGDDRKKPDKFMRIESLLEPLHKNGLFYLNADQKDNLHMLRLEEQFVVFGPGSRAHDDGPDAVEGAIWKIIEKTTLGAKAGIIQFKRPVNEQRL